MKYQNVENWRSHGLIIVLRFSLQQTTQLAKGMFIMTVRGYDRYKPLMPSSFIIFLKHCTPVRLLQSCILCFITVVKQRDIWSYSCVILEQFKKTYRRLAQWKSRARMSWTLQWTKLITNLIHCYRSLKTFLSAHMLKSSMHALEYISLPLH